LTQSPERAEGLGHGPSSGRASSFEETGIEDAEIGPVVWRVLLEGPPAVPWELGPDGITQEATSSRDDRP
jgi:hypothetical protein